MALPCMHPPLQVGARECADPGEHLPPIARNGGAVPRPPGAEPRISGAEPRRGGQAGRERACRFDTASPAAQRASACACEGPASTASSIPEATASCTTPRGHMPEVLVTPTAACAAGRVAPAAVRKLRMPEVDSQVRGMRPFEGLHRACDRCNGSCLAGLYVPSRRRATRGPASLRCCPT